MAEDKVVFEVAALDKASAVFRQIGGAAKDLQKSYQLLSSTFAAVGGGLLLREIVQDTLEWERASKRIDAVLRATGNAAGLTRHELDQIAASVARNTEFADNQVMSAQGNLLKFGNIHGDVFRRALKVSADYAAFTGSDMASATQALGSALADPIAGVRALQKEFRNLTFSEREHIEVLLANGEVEKAQIRILELVEKRVGGTAEKMNTGLVKAVSDLRKGWKALAETLGRFPEILPSALIVRALTPQAAGATEEELAIGAKNAAMLDKEAQARGRIHEAHVKALPVLAAWTRMLGEETNESRALSMVLEGEARSWNDLDKAKLLNMAVELDWRRIYKDRMDLAALYAKALQDETLGEAENLATRVKIVESDWVRGTREAFREYIDHAGNAAEQANMLFTNAFRNMEDGLVEFVRTGKLDFRSFADSVIADLIRIQIRQAMAGFAFSSTGFFAALGLGGGSAAALEVHSGGVVGVDGRPRFVDPAYFAGARRMHFGGLAGDEVPAILQRGERVIPRGGSAGPTIHIHQNIGGNVTRADLAATAEAARRGILATLAEERRRNPSGPFGG
jgi:lambda family phage tail tape measure protein